MKQSQAVAVLITTDGCSACRIAVQDADVHGHHLLLLRVVVVMPVCLSVADRYRQTRALNRCRRTVLYCTSQALY